MEVATRPVLEKTDKVKETDEMNDALILIQEMRSGVHGGTGTEGFTAALLTTNADIVRSMSCMSYLTGCGGKKLNVSQRTGPEG